MNDSRCGTYAGVIAHGRRKEKSCELCAAARREYAQKTRLPVTKPPILRDKCGSGAGFKAHERQGEHPCDSCRLEINRIVRERNAKIKELRAWKSREYRAKNLSHVRAVDKLWRDTNPEKRKAKDFTRYARKKNSPVIERLLRQSVLDKWGTNCHICGEAIDLKANRQTNPKGLHLDHVIALKNGGHHTLENVKPSHVFCNLSKGSS